MRRTWEAKHKRERVKQDNDEGHHGDDRKTEGTENGEKRPEAVRACSHDGESLVE